MPRMLYHYTTQAGLLGIAQSGCLWASNVRYLNDATEYMHAVHIAQRLCDQKVGISETESEFLQHLVRSLIGQSRSSTDMPRYQRLESYYVVSLTAEPDRLSQWRAYGAKNGYCVGWSTRMLEGLAKANGFELKECIYDNGEQESLISPILHRALENWRDRCLDVDLYATFVDPDQRDPAEKPAFEVLQGLEIEFEREFSRVATICKNEAFVEEREWRLIASSVLSDGTRRPMHFRHGKTMLIPYATLDLDRKSQTYVGIGPNPEPQLALRSAIR